MGVAILCYGFLAFVILLHLPIYLCYRSNKNNNKPPHPAIAVILSFVPSPLGGILYVNGLLGAVPCLVVLITVFSKVPGSSHRDGEAYILGYSVLLMAVLSMCSALIMRVSTRLVAKREAMKSMK